MIELFTYNFFQKTMHTLRRIGFVRCTLESKNIKFVCSESISVYP